MQQGKRDTVEAFLGRTKQAWDAGDAVAYGSQFTEDASYVIYLGDAFVGRSDIVAQHHEVFTKWQRGTRLVVAPIQVSQIDDDTLVVLTVGGIGKSDTIEYDKFQTYTLRNAEGRWECVAFQNTEMSKRAKKRYNTQPAHD